MASIISVLPPKLIQRIFSYLAGDVAAIGASRLVCSAFRELSSPFLITRVVFAYRLDAIDRLLKILAHPVFPKHITELVYDASTYDQRLADSSSEYEQFCGCVPQVFDDSEWLSRELEDRLTLQGLWKKATELDDQQPSSHEASRYMNGFHTPGDHDLNYVTSRDAQLGLRFGCHLSYPDYFRRYSAQCWIADSHMEDHVLEATFRGLPVLKAILFTDWRGLARPGESYNDCARRLFGNVLPPGELMANRNEEEQILSTVDRVLSLVQETGVPIECFGLGPHPFEDQREADWSQWYGGRNAQYFPAGVLLSPVLRDTISNMKDLKRLRLPIRLDTIWNISPSEFAPGYRPTILNTASNLTHLCLSFCFRHDPNPQDDVENEHEGRPFWFFVGGLHLPHLLQLDLRGWSMENEDLREVLSTHAATLQELRLLDCFLLGNPLSLAQWAGANLQLNGIELHCQLRPRRASSLMELTNYDLETDAELLTDSCLISDEHEPLWLDGRENKIVREQILDPLDGRGGVPWYLKPTAQ